jgi:hypothetical protein
MSNVLEVFATAHEDINIEVTEQDDYINVHRVYGNTPHRLHIRSFSKHRDDKATETAMWFARFMSQADLKATRQ